MEIKKLELKTDIGKLSKHTLYTQENSKGILVIFPGGNSSCDAPILQYISTTMFNEGYDILELSYLDLCDRSNQATIHNCLYSEINKAMSVVINKKYPKTYFLSRSFGNVISTAIRAKYNVNTDAQVFMAPIPDAIPKVIELGGLVIAGTKDSYITSEDLERLRNVDGLSCKIIKNANHSLESDDSIIETIDMAKEIVIDVLSHYNINFK